MKRPSLAPIAACIALSLACGGGAEVITVEAQLGSFAVSLVESGELRAVDSVSVTVPQVAGSLQVVHLIGEGTAVVAGQELVRFDPAEVEERVRRAETELRQARAAADQLRAEQAIARRELELHLQDARIDLEQAQREISKGDLLPRLEREMASLRRDRAATAVTHTEQQKEDQEAAWRSEHAVQQAKVEAAGNGLRRARAELAQLSLSAPRDGLVVLNEIPTGTEQRKVREGDTVWPGFELLSLPDLSAMEVVVQVVEAEAGLVRPGQPCRVRLDAYADRAYTGRIERVANLATRASFVSRIKTVEVIVALEETDVERMKPGLSCQVEIFQAELRDVVFVPLETVFSRGGREVVYVRESRGFRAVEVTLGARNLNQVVVLGGLDAGSTVALTDPTGRARVAE